MKRYSKLGRFRYAGPSPITILLTALLLIALLAGFLWLWDTPGTMP